MSSQNARDECCRRREKGTLENYSLFNGRVGRIASGVTEAAAGTAQSPLLWDCFWRWEDGAFAHIVFSIWMLLLLPPQPHLIKLPRPRSMAPHSSTLAWKIPWTEEPGRLQSMGLHRVGHDWVTSLSLFTFVHWRRKWQPTPVFLLGESQGRGSLVGCRLWGRTELDTTEVT